MIVTGKIKYKSGDIQVSASFKKSELVVTTDEQYPQHILIEFHQDKCDLIDPYKIGESVEVHINLAGREWINPQGEAKYFNTIKGWRISRTDNSKQQPQSNTATTNTAPKQVAPAEEEEEEEDDLPF